MRKRHRTSGKYRPLLILSLSALALLLVFAAGVWAARRVYPYNYRQSIERYAAEEGLDPLFIAAVIRTESSFRPNAVSGAGACGLMQFMPKTAQWVAERNDIPFSEKDIFIPDTNIRLGCKYYRYLKDRFGSDSYALAAWNAGEGKVRRWMKEGLTEIPYEETRNFVRRVTNAYEKYKIIYAH